MALAAAVFLITFGRTRIQAMGEDAQEVTELLRRAFTRVVGDRVFLSDQEVAEAWVGMVGPIQFQKVFPGDVTGTKS